MSKEINAKDLVDLDRKKLPAKLPEKIGGLLDYRFKLKLQKEAVEKFLKGITEDITRVEDAIFLQFKSDDIKGARGDLAQASISTQIIPIAEDWDEIYKYIKKTRGNDGFSLLQRRLGTATIKEMWADGKEIKGIGKMEKQRLSVTKIK